MEGSHRLPGRRLVPALAACLATCALLPAFAAADEAAVVYDPTRVSAIDLQLPPESIANLEADPEGEYQPGTFSFALTDGSPDGVGAFSTPQVVEVRLKGDASFKPLSGKAAFKLKFPKAGPFLGLRKMTLNNMVEDPSMTHETLSYALHRALGVPASRTGFAYLTLNGQHYGLYLNVENYDDVAMAKKLGAFDGDVQHVYEGENGADVEPGLIGDFEIDEGPEDDVSDLEGLAAAVTDPGAGPWWAAVGALADLDEMTRMWAAEKYSGQFDGYAGGSGPGHPNNYFLVTGPDGLFRMLPWGQDETWQADNHLPFEGEAGLMFERCLADAPCRSRYLNALRALQSTLPSLQLDALAVRTAQLLAPWQRLEEEESTRFEHDAADIAAAVAETRQFIATRPGELAAFLGPLDPPPAPIASVRRPQAKLLSISRRGRRLQVEVVSPSGGAFRLTARTTGRRGARVCGKRTWVAAGPDRVSCRLSRAALELLEDGPLRLRVRVRFPAADGISPSLARKVRLPRL